MCEITPERIFKIMSRFIFTCQPDSIDLALAEVKKADSSLFVYKWLEAGCAVCETKLVFSEYSAALRASSPIFVRHICPADGETTPDSLDVISEYALQYLSEGESFSVQIRSLSGQDADSRRAAMQEICSPIEEQGYVSDKSSPQKIISVMLGETTYFGISSPEENLSSWAGGMRRFAREESTASRAEFKLLEALELIGKELPQKGRALDLGAAPGGWTRVLAQKGLSVVAVDPANLAPEVLSLKNVSHFKGTSQQYLLEPRGKFDIIVNDMKLDIPESARVMVECADCLSDDGFAVMTFKLKPKKWTAQINAGLSVLEKGYEVLTIRQLFHNRSEITVILTKK